MSQETIKVGIAGLGRSGWGIHAHLLSQLPEQFQVAAVLDADESRRQEAIEQFDCLTYDADDYEKFIQDDAVELVVNSLPSFLHASGSIAAMRAGKHVVCEKPMATSLADADKMIAAATETGRVLTIFQQRRYQPEFLKIREIIESGLLGQIVQINIAANGFSRRWDWQTLQKYGGGSLNNTGPHFLDQALLLYGDGYPDVVFGHLARTLTLGDADDHVKIVFKGEDRPTVDIEISSCTAYGSPLWNIRGTSGGLKGTTRELEWKWVDWTEAPMRSLSEDPTPDRSYNRDQLAWHEDSWNAEEQVGVSFLNFYHDLHNTIRNGAPLAITPQEIRRVIWLQEEAHRLSPL